MRGLPTRVRQLVEKARDAATMAIDVYNRPATTFRSPAYIVLMIIAWAALFHAIFERRKVAYYYRKELAAIRNHRWRSKGMGSLKMLTRVLPRQSARNAKESRVLHWASQQNRASIHS